MAALVQFDGITKRFGGTTALDAVTFSIQAGEIHALMGENGAGKSTLMKILSGVLSKDSGELLLGDTLTAFKSEHQIAGDNWLIAKASARDVRSLAAALGIQYRELPDHSFNHSAVVSVTDRGGTVRARTSDLNDSDGTFIAAVRRQVHATSRP